MTDTVDTIDTGDTPSRNTRARAWCFVWNNYTDQDFNEMESAFKNDTETQYIMGREVAPTTGTPHIQGAVRFKNARTFESLKKKWPKVNWSMMRKPWIAQEIYCSKQDKNYATNMNVDKSTKKKTPAEKQYDEYMEGEFKDIEWKGYQIEILNLLRNNPDKRKVHWYWREEGNVGKSWIAKYVEWKHDAIIANGKQADVFNQYKTHLETKKIQPTVAIIDIPRSHKDYVCYSTLEKIKDGLFYSGKYEGGKLRLVPHHLIVFANFPPNKDKLSLDRWDIVEIGDDWSIIESSKDEIVFEAP